MHRYPPQKQVKKYLKVFLLKYFTPLLGALILWQQVTNVATVMAHCGISPNKYGSLSKMVCFQILCVSVFNLREICVSNMVIHLAGG